MAGQGIPLAPLGHRAAHHVLRGPVVLDEVEVDRDEVPDPVPKIPGQRQRLEKHLGQEHGRSDIEVDPTIVQIGDHGRQEAEIPLRGLAHHRPVAARVHVEGVGAQGHVNRAGAVQPRARREDALGKVGRPHRQEPLPQGPTEAPPTPHPFRHRLVDDPARLLGHAELALHQLGFDVLRGEAGIGQLKVVDGPRPVHGHGRHEPPLQQVHQDGREPHLDDVGPHPQDHGLAAPLRLQDGRHDLPEALHRQLVRQRFEVAPKASACLPGARRIRHRDLARPRGEGIRLHPPQVEWFVPVAHHAFPVAARGHPAPGRGTRLSALGSRLSALIKALPGEAAPVDRRGPGAGPPL